MMTLAVLVFFGGFFRFIFGLIWIILIVVTLLDLFKADMPTNTKLLWLIIILVAPIFGSLIYLYWGRYQKV